MPAIIDIQEFICPMFMMYALPLHPGFLNKSGFPGDHALHEDGHSSLDKSQGT